MACLALAAGGAQKSQGGGEARGEDSGRLYPVLFKHRWGYVDRSGRTVIEPKYDNEAFFSDGVAVVMSGLDHERAERTRPRGNMVEIKPGPDGVKWEIIDTSGKTLAALPRGTYLSAFFSEGLSPVSGWEEGKGSVYGYMDKTGRVVIRAQFERAGHFSEGLADACTESGRCGFIDHAGKFVVPPRYKEVHPFSEDLAYVVTRDGRAGFVNKSGEMVIAPQFEPRPFGDFKEGLAAVTLPDSKKFGYIDKTGQFRIQPEFGGALEFSDGLAPVSTNGRWGYIDREGRFVIAPQFAVAMTFSEGLAPVSTCTGVLYPSHEHTGKCGYGYIDKIGRFVIDQRFEDGGPF
ncbi:MAG TPA: WG repeat-containing protein, partial [Pyrinomonadaceae bacterium]